MSGPTQIVATLAVFVHFVVYDWLFWETLFPELSSTPVSWLWFHGASAVMAACFVALFARGRAGGRISGGLRFGILAGLFWAGSELMSYAIAPGALSNTLGNAAGDVGMFVLAGILVALIESRSR